MKKVGFVALVMLLMCSLIACDTDEHIGQAKTPSGSKAQKGRDYQSVVADFEENGFVNIELVQIEDLILGWLVKDGEVESVSIDGDVNYSPGKWVSANAKVVISYHTFPQNDSEDTEQETISENDNPPEQNTNSDEVHSVYYSTNDSKTVKEGNTGVYAYKKEAYTYDIYYIIDFDEGYAYYFTYGNGDKSCDREKMVSGSLNDALILAVHDGDDVWYERLYFKWVNQPDHLIVQDGYGYKSDFYPTDLNEALKLRDSMRIIDR